MGLVGFDFFICAFCAALRDVLSISFERREGGRLGTWHVCVLAIYWQKGKASASTTLVLMTVPHYKRIPATGVRPTCFALKPARS